MWMDWYAYFIMRIPHYGDNGIDTGNSSEKGLPQAGLTPRLKSPCMQTYKQTNKQMEAICDYARW